MKNTYYKYRKIDTLDRDLASLLNDELHASTIKELNDPFEGKIIYQDMVEKLQMISEYLKNDFPIVKNFYDLIGKRETQGIYALSRAWDDELLWAHYASEHRGYCIEYDVDYLQRFYLPHFVTEINVEYITKPKKISDELLFITTPLRIIQALNGLKSKAWEYEQELRLVFDESGLKQYDTRALKSITFGLNISDENKNKIISALTGKAIKYYQIEMKQDEYKLDRFLITENILNIYNRELTIDDFYFTKDWLNDYFSKKDLLHRAIKIISRDPFILKIDDIGFHSNGSLSEPLIYVNTTVKNHKMPVVQYFFKEIDLKNLEEETELNLLKYESTFIKRNFNTF